MFRTKNLFILFVALIASLLLGACSKTTVSDAPPNSTVSNAAPVANVNAEGKLLCPVQRNTIASKEVASGHSDYKGKRYYFCCAECKPKFDADPAKYATTK